MLFRSFSVLGIVISTFLVANTMAAIMIEEQRQIGVLKAVGATTGFIFRQLLIQALLVALGGIVIAVPLAWLTNRALQQAPDAVPIAFTTQTFVVTSALLLVMAVVGVLFSGRQVAKVDPIIALGQQQ